MKRQEPSRQTILQEIADEFAMVIQNQESKDSLYFSSAATNSLSKVNCLIELLEVNDCGSVGGFDKGQQGYVGTKAAGNKDGFANPYWQTLFGRFDWLVQKYETKIKKTHRGNIDNLRDYFRYRND